MPFLSKRHRNQEEQDRRREEQMRAIWHMLSVCGLIFLSFTAFLGFILVLPAWLELQSLQQKKESVIRRLNKAQEEEEETHNRYIWMMDPEYFEQIARDRANQAKAGEKVIRRTRATNHAAGQDTPAHPVNSSH